jgi:hypothetical protein
LYSLGVVALVLLASVANVAAQMEVKHAVGARHGFLTIRSQGGVNLGYGELSEYATGDLVTVDMAYHFLDGSLDEELSVFSQRKNFQFVSDHHVQRGRFFKQPTDIMVEASGKVTTRSVDKNGQTKVDTEQMQIPADFATGLVGTLMENIPANAAEFKLSMIVATPKPRAIKLDILRQGQQSFRIAGTSRKADVFRLRPEIGGIAGVIAPIVGLQPADILISVMEGDVPMVVRIQQSLAQGSPVVNIELAGAAFAKTGGSGK